MDIFFTCLLSPFWIGHFLVRRFLYGDGSWTIQNSLDLVWAGDETLGYAQRELSLEEARLKLPEELYMADVYLHYGRLKEARREVESFLSNHPDDPRAVAIIKRIEDR